MLSPRLIVTVLAGALSLAVAAPAQAHATHAKTAAGSSSSHYGTTHTGGPRQDRNFLVAAHQGNLAEIDAGRVALAKSQNPEVRRIATVLIADHRKLDAQVRLLARQHGVSLPTAPSRKQQAELAAVARKSGNAFDVAWLRLQERAHLQTLMLIRQELRHGHLADVRAAARTARPVVLMHLRMVRDALHHQCAAGRR
jgi:putative membrane protein